MFKMSRLTLTYCFNLSCPGIPLSNIEKSLREYAACAAGEKTDPFGKQTFPTVIDISEETANKVYVALVTPVIHYSLGGIKVGECRM